MKKFLLKHLDDCLFVIGAGLIAGATAVLSWVAALYVVGGFCLAAAVLIKRCRKGVDDIVIHLTPTEDRKLAELSVGAAGQAILINSTNQHLYLATELAAKVEKLEREMKAHKAHKANPLQMDLLEQA